MYVRLVLSVAFLSKCSWYLLLYNTWNNLRNEFDPPYKHLKACKVGWLLILCCLTFDWGLFSYHGEVTKQSAKWLHCICIKCSIVKRTPIDRKLSGLILKHRCQKAFMSLKDQHFQPFNVNWFESKFPRKGRKIKAFLVKIIRLIMAFYLAQMLWR